MDVMQKLRGRLNRSSRSSDVANICIPVLPLPTTSDRRLSVDVLRKYSTSGSVERRRMSLIETQEYNEKLATEPYSLLHKKLLEKDKQIKELQISIEQIRQDRLQDEEVRYQRSVLAKRQHIDNLEAELEKMKCKVEQMTSDADKRVQKAKRQIVKVKQDCALKVFELKQEKALLQEEVTRLSSNTTANLVSGNLDSQTTCLRMDSTDNTTLEQRAKNELVLQLSEQISHLHQENLKLKDDLQETERQLSNLKKVKP